VSASRRSHGDSLGPTVAGRWYPARAADLERQVDGLLESCTRCPGEGPPRALIAPHAAFIYSGSVAASAFRALSGRPALERVILLGPAHFVAIAG